MKKTHLNPYPVIALTSNIAITDHFRRGPLLRPSAKPNLSLIFQIQVKCAFQEKAYA
jgi:hypothetical protein